MIVVFGSLNVDLVMQVSTLPRPGETVLCPGYRMKAGGKGANQAVAAARAGAQVGMYGQVGDDAFGPFMTTTLGSEGIDVSGVGTVRGRPTGCAAICVDDAAENLIAVASGANLDAAANQVPDAKLGAETTLLMQMEVPHAENWALLARARGRGARTILNVAPAAVVPRAALEQLDVLVLNEMEARTVAGDADLGISDGPAELAAALARLGGRTCVITLGSRGTVAADAGGTVWGVGVLPITPVDTTGAGDAYCGVLAAGLDGGLDLPEALHRAAVGAGLACLALGAQESLPRRADIDARLAELPPPARIA